MQTYLNTQEPYEELGNRPKGNADCVRQNGIIFWWSESNMCYERAWWLYPEAPDTPLVQHLRKERALPEGISI